MLAARPDAYIVLLGVTHENSTMFHHVEEMAGVPYHMQPGFATAAIIQGETRTTRHIMLHRYGTPRNFSVMEPLFVEQGIQRVGQIGAANVRLVHVPAMVRRTLRAVTADPRILCGT